jgi:hypothetical protein
MNRITVLQVVACNEESSLVRKEKTYAAHTEPVPRLAMEFHRIVAYYFLC